MHPQRRAAIYDVTRADPPALARDAHPRASTPSAPAATPASSSATTAIPIAISIAALLFTFAACSRETTRTGAGPGSSPTALTAKESRVYDVASPADLLAVQSAYLQHAAAGFTGRFEIRFTASLPALSWSLAPEAGHDLPAFELVLTGHGAVLPAPGMLAARTVHLEGLVLTGPVGLSSAIEVRTAFTMRDCAVIDGRGTIASSQEPYLTVRAHGVRGVKSPATLTLERSWFVRNWQADDSTRGAPLFGTGAHDQDGGYFSEVRLRDSVFLGNAFATEIQLTHALDVSLERCLLAKTWPSGVLLDAAMAAQVRVVDSILLVDDLAHLARLGPEVPPIEITGSRLYATTYSPQSPLPSTFHLVRSVVSARATIEAQLAPLDAAAKLPVAMPPADLRQQLMQALQP